MLFEGVRPKSNVFMTVWFVGICMVTASHFVRGVKIIKKQFESAGSCVVKLRKDN